MRLLLLVASLTALASVCRSQAPWLRRPCVEPNDECLFWADRGDCDSNPVSVNDECDCACDLVIRRTREDAFDKQLAAATKRALDRAIARMMAMMNTPAPYNNKPYGADKAVQNAQPAAKPYPDTPPTYKADAYNPGPAANSAAYNPAPAVNKPPPASYNPTPAPYNPTPAPYNPAPYNPTPVPYNPTPVPYNPTQAPYNPTPAPYNPTPAPYNAAPAVNKPPPVSYNPAPAVNKPPPAQYNPKPAPYNPTPAPYNPTPAPYIPTPAPYNPTPAPYNNPAPAVFQPPPATYQPTPAPYNPTPAPYNPTPAPYNPTPAPYNPTPAPYNPTPAPYNPTPAPYNPTPAPYNPTPAPYNPTPAPYNPAPAAYQQPDVGVTGNHPSTAPKSNPNPTVLNPTPTFINLGPSPYPDEQRPFSGNTFDIAPLVTSMRPPTIVKLGVLAELDRQPASVAYPATTAPAPQPTAAAYDAADADSTDNPSTIACPLDVLLMLDASGRQIGILNRYKAEAIKLVQRLGWSGTRMALMSFGANVTNEGHMKDFGTTARLLTAAIQEVRWQPGGRGVAEALGAATLDFDLINGARPRKQAAHVAILFSNGFSCKPPAAYAQELRDRGVLIYVLHADGDASHDEEELLAITGSRGRIFGESEAHNLFTSILNDHCSTTSAAPKASDAQQWEDVEIKS